MKLILNWLYFMWAEAPSTNNNQKKQEYTPYTPRHFTPLWSNQETKPDLSKLEMQFPSEKTPQVKANYNNIPWLQDITEEEILDLKKFLGTMTVDGEKIREITLINWYRRWWGGPIIVFECGDITGRLRVEWITSEIILAEKNGKPLSITYTNIYTK